MREMKQEMKRTLVAVVVGIALGVVAIAQQTTGITGGTTPCPGAACVTQTTANQGSIAVQISGTWVGTITFSGSIDGVNFTALGLSLVTTPGTIVTTTTGNGVWNGSVAGLQQVRVAFTAYTSGTAVISTRTAQSAKVYPGAGGGGGGSGTVTSITASSPLSGGVITTTGTIGCATCVTSAAALTSNGVVLGGGLQATSVAAADTTTTHAFFATATAPAFRAIVAGDIPTLNQNTSGNAATVTTNANLTGPITSVGNATSLAAQTGIGSVIVVATSPTLVTPLLGTPTSVTLTNATGLVEAGLSLTDITTANVSATAHGFAPKFPNNTTTFLRGDGTYAAATVGNLTGPITSTGLATAIAAQTGTGSTFVVNTSPTIVTPTITTSAVFGNGQGFYDQAANIIAQRNGVSAQIFNLYNTYTDASNYERLSIGWASNIITITPQNAGTGSAREVILSNGSAIIGIFNNGDLNVNTGSGGAFKVTQASVNSSSGTSNAILLSSASAPNSTSTLAVIPLQVNSTINFNNGTPGAGHYETLKIAVTETALPTGQSYLIRASAGVAGTTDKFTVANTGDVTGRHYMGNGAAPAVTNTSANSCGTTAATIVGTDTAGKVTAGATSATSCTVTFTAAYANAPACAAIDESTAVLTTAKSTTTTVILSGVFTAADVIAYHCLGY